MECCIKTGMNACCGLVEEEEKIVNLLRAIPNQHRSAF